MKLPSDQDLKSFENALQLCIETKIHNVTLGKDNYILVNFDKAPQDDEQLFLFFNVVEGKWENKNKSYRISEIDLQEVINFLLITRLNKENMMKLAEMDPEAEKMVTKMGLKTKVLYINDIKHASKIVFEQLSKRNMTMRELSQRTGLTQVSLSKFKAGNDIRLSNLIKIAGALNLKLILR